MCALTKLKRFFSLFGKVGPFFILYYLNSHSPVFIFIFFKYNFLPFYLWKMIIRWWMKMSINFLTKDSSARSLLNFRLWWIKAMIFHSNQLSSPPRLVVKHSPNVKSERTPRSWRHFTRLTLTVKVVHQLSERTEQKDSVRVSRKWSVLIPPTRCKKFLLRQKKKLLQSFCGTNKPKK